MIRFIHRRVRAWRVALACVALLSLGAIGCLDIPLGDPDQSAIDSRILGYWQGPTNGDIKELDSVEAADKHALLIRSYRYTEADDGMHRQSQAAFIAWLTPVGGQTFITIEARDPLETFMPESERKRAYLIARIAFTGQGITLDPLNDDVAKPARSPDELAKLIADNSQNAGLYDTQRKWAKVTDGQLVQTVLNAF